MTLFISEAELGRGDERKEKYPLSLTFRRPRFQVRPHWQGFSHKGPSRGRTMHA